MGGSDPSLPGTGIAQSRHRALPPRGSLQSAGLAAPRGLNDKAQRQRCPARIGPKSNRSPALQTRKLPLEEWASSISHYEEGYGFTARQSQIAHDGVPARHGLAKLGDGVSSAHRPRMAQAGGNSNAATRGGK